MLTQFLLTAATTTANNGQSSLDNVYYILASIALIGGFLEGMRRFLAKQRSKWTEEGKNKADQSRITQENTTQLRANTDAIAKLTDANSHLATQMTEFITSVHSELNGLGKRITRLEFSQARRPSPNGDEEA